MNDNPIMQPKRHAVWHAFQALTRAAAGDQAGADEHMESAREWLTLSGIACKGATAEEICGLVERAKTGVLEG